MTSSFVVSRFGKNALALLLSLFIIYFLYHLVQGDLGVVSWMRAENRLQQVAQKHQQLLAERAFLEHKNKLLGSDLHPIDKDLLDEQARSVLGLAQNNEIVIYLGSEPK